MIIESSDRTITVEVTDGQVTHVDVDPFTYGFVNDRLATAIGDVAQGLLDAGARPASPDVVELEERFEEIRRTAQAQLGALYSDRERIVARLREMSDDMIAQWRSSRDA